MITVGGNQANLGLGAMSGAPTASGLANAASAFRTGGLVYPSDTGTLSRTSHYVQFFINEQAHGSARFSTGAYVSNGTQSERLPGTLERAPTVRTLGSICLYMPSQIQVSQKANYGEAEIGALVAGGMAAINAMQGKSESDLSGFVDSFKEEGKRGLVAAMEGAGATGATAVLAISEGKVTNNRTEMKFEGIDRRAFQFSFRLLPRSAQEAQRIKDIVTMFRLHSMPEFATSTSGTTALGRTLISPSTFDIEYTPGEHLHKIGTCVLEAVDVKYGGDRPQFFKDNQPVETELTLSFKELEIVTKEKIAQGY